MRCDLCIHAIMLRRHGSRDAGGRSTQNQPEEVESDRIDNLYNNRLKVNF